MQIGNPGPASSDRIEWADHLGELLLMAPTEVIAGINTKQGATDVTVSSVHVVDGAEPGLLREDAYIFPSKLQRQLSPYVAQATP